MSIIRDMKCRYHPDSVAEFQCAGCHQYFCSKCVKEISGNTYCKVCQPRPKLRRGPGGGLGGLTFAGFFLAAAGFLIWMAILGEGGVSWSLLAFAIILLSYPFLWLWGYFRDITTGTAKLIGVVRGKEDRLERVYYETGSAEYHSYHIWVNDREFVVFKEDYGWLWECHEVVVCYWPHSGTVVSIRKAGSSRGWFKSRLVQAARINVVLFG